MNIIGSFFGSSTQYKSEVYAWEKHAHIRKCLRYVDFLSNHFWNIFKRVGIKIEKEFQPRSFYRFYLLLSVKSFDKNGIFNEGL